MGFDFFKIDGNGEGLKIMTRKGAVGVVGGWGEGKAKWGLPYYIEFFLEIPYDAA